MRIAGMRIFDIGKMRLWTLTLTFDFEPARLSAAHLGAGETSETNIKV